MTLVPAQIVVADAAIEILAGKAGLIVIVTTSELTGPQDAELVKRQRIKNPFHEMSGFTRLKVFVLSPLTPAAPLVLFHVVPSVEICH